MISILIKNSELILKDPSKDLFSWNHRAFFNIALALEIDEPNNCYTYKNVSEFQNVVNEIVEYLREEQIEFSLDNQVATIVADIQTQKAEFDETIINLKKQLEVSQPNTITRELTNYQIKGLEHFIKVRHGANFSVPGSGKTTMVYAYFDRLKNAGIVDKIFVVGPFSSFSPWEEEAEKCFGRKLSSARLAGTKRQSVYLQSAQYELFLCHYQTVANDISNITDLCKTYKILMVVDESHYIKRLDGGVWSSALLALAPFATRRVILSGTPMPNGLVDLWSQMTFLWPGKQLLGERSVYKLRCDDISQVDNVKRDIKPFFYRVTKSDLKLPKPKFNRIEFSLKPIQAQIYHSLSVRLLSELKIQPEERLKLREWRRAKMVRLMQTASNPTLLSRYSEEFELPALSSDGTSLIELIQKYSSFEIPAKFEAAINLTRKLLKEGKKVIVWTSFIHNIKMLEAAMTGVNCYTIYGGIPKDDREDEDFNREKQIREFKTTNTPSLLIANPAACAESISLHKICHDAIYLDRTFNCGQYIQSLDRIHRIGLKPNETVNYHILIARNTIDETIDQRLNDKQAIMTKVLEDEIPIGSFDIDGPEMEQKESEELKDFEATTRDTQSFLKTQPKKKLKR